MILHWLITGDTHGVNNTFARNAKRMYPEVKPNEIGLISLGDAGFNFGRPEEDAKWKKIVNKIGVQIYCVRGNHDQRPETIEEIKMVWDHEVSGNIYWEEKYPNIHYFIDGNVYTIEGLRTLVLGGAYSVDKYYRMENAMYWEPEEQLSEAERNEIFYSHMGERFSLILSHTCPISWQPTDLFLSFVDQSTVDTTMEEWLEEFKNRIYYKAWLFGHYHDDRLVRPGAQMLYKKLEPLKDIYQRWFQNNPEYFIGWAKDPKYYYEEGQI